MEQQTQSNLNLADFSAEVAQMPSVTPKRILTHFDYGAIYAARLRKSLENGTSPFLPKDGIVKANGVYNMRTNSLHHGIQQLMLKERQAELGSPSTGFVSLDMIDKARRNGFDCAVKMGEHGFDILVQNPKNKEDTKTIKWFNESQLTKPENLKAFLVQEQKNNAKFKQEWLDKNKPGFTARDASLINPARENHGLIECTAKTPEEYLGQVFAAMSTGNDLKVAPEIADNFAKKTRELLDKKLDFKPEQTDLLAVFKLASKANEYCQAYCRAIYKEQEKRKEKSAPVQKKTRGRDEEYGRALY